MNLGRDKLGVKFLGWTLGFFALFLSSCVAGSPPLGGGLSEPGAGGLAQNTPLGGPVQSATSPLDPQGPSPDFDPEGNLKYYLYEDQSSFYQDAQGSKVRQLEGILIQTRKSGSQFPTFGDRSLGPAVEVSQETLQDSSQSSPCCEGQWLLLRIQAWQLCLLSPIQEGGKVVFNITYPSRIFRIEEGTPLFYLSKPGYDPGEDYQNFSCEDIEARSDSFFPEYISLIEKPSLESEGEALAEEGEGVGPLQEQNNTLVLDEETRREILFRSFSTQTLLQESPEE